MIQNVKKIKVKEIPEKKLKNGSIKSAHLQLTCGCCHQKVNIFYDNDGLEINGVNGSIENWREILLPLLNKKDSCK